MPLPASSRESRGAAIAGCLFGVRLATLHRGAHFFAGGCHPPGDAAPMMVSGPYRAKVIGNSLRELDRFLNLLADEVGRVLAWSDEDLRAIERERNTANKIRSLRGRRGLASPDHARLRALGRSRDCMFHCDGLVQRGDGPGAAYMTLGWTGGGRTDEDGGASAGGDNALLRVAVGDRIEMPSRALIEVGQFYRGVATNLAKLRG